MLSNSTANTLLPTVLALPILTDAPRMPALAVELSADDPPPGCPVGVYQAKPVYRPWLVERIGSVTDATLHPVFAVMVGYLDRWPNPPGPPRLPHLRHSSDTPTATTVRLPQKVSLSHVTRVWTDAGGDWKITRGDHSQ
jgi:mRNA-degrading endonuclease toxin of MazEF toxin-antitoxin module